MGSIVIGFKVVGDALETGEGGKRQEEREVGKRGGNHFNVSFALILDLMGDRSLLSFWF